MTSGDAQRSCGQIGNGLSYRAAGVDIEAGDALVEQIKPLARATARPGVIGGLGGFGALFDPKAAGFADPVLVASTDGVGTKLRVAIETGIHNTVGIDLVAMCVNDLVVQGAEPLFFLDYYATGALDVAAARAVIAGIASGCAEAGCALVGGETAEMPGMYAGGDYDLAGFAVGAAERGTLLPRDVAPGDAVLGLASDGLHSNGFSLVRRVVAASGLAWDAPAPFAPPDRHPRAAAPDRPSHLAAPAGPPSPTSDRPPQAQDRPPQAQDRPPQAQDRVPPAPDRARPAPDRAPMAPDRARPAPDRAPMAPDRRPHPTLGQALMTPTRIYVRSVLALHRAGLLKAAAHITGGGLPGNLPRVLPAGCVAVLDPVWPVPPVFAWLARTGGVAAQEMLRVFNCGIGMALVVADADAATVLLEAEGERVMRIGTIEAGGGEAATRIEPGPGWLA